MQYRRKHCKRNYFIQKDSPEMKRRLENWRPEHHPTIRERWGRMNRITDPLWWTWGSEQWFELCFHPSNPVKHSAQQPIEEDQYKSTKKIRQHFAQRKYSCADFDVFNQTRKIIIQKCLFKPNNQPRNFERPREYFFYWAYILNLLIKNDERNGVIRKDNFEILNKL